MTHELGGTQPGESDEISNQVGLIEVAALGRELRPVRGGPLRQHCGALKSLNTAEQLWGHTDLGGENLDQPTMTEAHLRHDVPDRRPATELGERNLDRSVPPARATEPGQQRGLEKLKAPRRT